jgi:hypothetical protein
MAAMHVEGRRQARLGEAFGGNAGASAWKPQEHTTLGTPPLPSDRVSGSAIAGGKLRVEHRKMAFTSSGASVCGRGDRPRSEKIIGRSMSVFRERFAGGGVFLCLLRAFLLFHQPACQQGRGVFFRPKVQERANLFAQIDGF